MIGLYIGHENHVLTILLMFFLAATDVLSNADDLELVTLAEQMEQKIEGVYP